MSIINLSNFTILNLIGKGQNPVYRVQHKENGEFYALKKIRRFDFQQHLTDLQEILYLTHCDHPNIIKILGFSMTVNKVSSFEIEYIIHVLMNLMEKTMTADIQERNSQGKPYTKEEFLGIFSKISSALYYLQKTALIAHRDIKPENIILNKDNEPFLIDFGESFLQNKFKKSASTLVGTPYYMSPELRLIYLNESSERPAYNPWKSDVYSFGMCLIELANLKINDKTKISEKLKNIANFYGDEVKTLIEKMVEDDMEKRYDFIGLYKSQEYENLFKKNVDKDILELDIQEEEEVKNEEEIFKKEVEIDCLSSRFYDLISKIDQDKENLSHENELIFNEIIKEIEKIEEENALLGN